MRSVGIFLLVIAAAACRGKVRFTEPLALAGGKSVPPDVLNDGSEAYMLYCFACHGEKGDGRGPSAPGMRPPPRDFTTGKFKFGGVPSGQLPHDEDLDAIVKNGLAGTPMLPWDVTVRERHAIIQYLKTFSEIWKTEEPGQRVVPDGPDPWVGKEAEALELGKRIYHLTGAEMDPATQQPKHVYAGCNGCHPSYLPRQELTQLSQQVLQKPFEFRPGTYLPEEAKPTDYTVDQKPLNILPIDFLFHEIKNGTSPEALYRTISAGVGGTAMPNWSVIKGADMWALVHYVKSLADVRGTPGAIALQGRLLGRN